MADGVDELLAKHACMELVYRLARGLDRCDEGELRSVFHADATDDHGLFKGSAAEFVDWVLPQLRAMERTQHLIGNVLIDVAGEKAWGESYFVASHDLLDAGGQQLRYVASGRYLDHFEKRDGEWRIAHRGCVYDWSDSGPRREAWDRTAPGPRRFGTRGMQDPVYGEGMAPRKGSAS